MSGFGARHHSQVPPACSVSSWSQWCLRDTNRSGWGTRLQPVGSNSVNPENQRWGDKVNEVSDGLRAGGQRGATVTAGVPGDSCWGMSVRMSPKLNVHGFCLCQSWQTPRWTRWRARGPRSRQRQQQGGRAMLVFGRSVKCACDSGRCLCARLSVCACVSGTVISFTAV